MSFHPREATAADRDAILALRRRAFPDVDREKQAPAFWHWEFAGGRMFVAEDGARVAGHFGFVPRCFTIGEHAPVLLRPTLLSIPIPIARREAVISEIVDRPRFDSSPIWRYTRREHAGAYLVSRDSVLKGINTHCLVDFCGDPEALRALVHQAIADARHRGILLAAALVSRDHPHFATLMRCGFFPGPHRFRLPAQSFDSRIDLHQRWALTWSSTDHV